MNGGRQMPKPAGREPVLSAGLVLAGYTVSTAAAGVFGGGAISGAIAGHGFGGVALQQMSATLVRLAAHPCDPAAAWPGDPRPGPAWLTWLCISLVAVVWCAVIGVGSIEIGQRARHRHRDGLAGTTDLRNIGLDEHSARGKAVQEYPRLAGEQPHCGLRRRWPR